jgi:hypothetical protein
MSHLWEVKTQAQRLTRDNVWNVGGTNDELGPLSEAPVRKRFARPMATAAGLSNALAVVKSKKARGTAAQRQGAQ